MATRRTQKDQPNPFMAKATTKPEAVQAQPKPRAKKTSKANLSLTQKVVLEIVSGDMDEELLVIMEAINTRREVLKEKLLAQVKAVYGDDYVVTKPGTATPSALPGNVFADKAAESGAHANEVQATGFAAEGLPDLSLGFGSPSIHDSGQVSAAADPMGGMAEAGSPEITTTGAIIG